ncbi:hypothetical protein SAMN05192583_2664 [Sphingomonas gellani]|uniref:PilZ domain-containing protein n=1 Tax=Sphingomonas gellani TaxID=1166340 RepID=A0A1H8G2I8_9SPHN|nr:hypothetical protein [Sphingomonas gellani]SEN37975.1 hypothetical protein SAMN05192583_2664 [Sphingomonas gellani]
MQTAVLDHTRFVKRAERLELSFPTEISGPTTAPFTALAMNISRSGMLVDDAGSLQVDDFVIAILPKLGGVLCRVARLSKGRAGLKFDREIDLKPLLS